MLTKLTPPAISAGDPFANDVLKRKPSVLKLTSLIESTKQPFVLSVEAPWGWGKTTFIRMWQTHLEAKGHVCFHFNAWENDFADDPLVGFLGEMGTLLEKRGKAKGKIQERLDSIKRSGGLLLRKVVPVAIQVATHGALSADAVKETLGSVREELEKFGDLASDLAKERLEKYEAEKKGVKAFRENLEKLAQELVCEQGCVSPLVFFIDELDRCRPDFAISLLERIKHLFNVQHVVFVLSVDRSQINQCVKARYGFETDPDGYLRRFIDLAFSLPAPNAEDFAIMLYSRFSLDECSVVPQMIVRPFSKFARAFGLSLRTQEQCFTEINILLRTSRVARRNSMPVVVCFLVALRAFKPTVFRELYDKRVTIEAVLQWISPVEDKWFLGLAENILVFGFLNRQDRDERLGRLADQSNAATDSELKQRAHESLQNLRETRFGDPEDVAVLIKELEMTEFFQ